MCFSSNLSDRPSQEVLQQTEFNKEYIGVLDSRTTINVIIGSFFEPENNFQSAYIRSSQPIMYASVQTWAIGRRRKFCSRRNSTRNISDFRTSELWLTWLLVHVWSLKTIFSVHTSVAISKLYMLHVKLERLAVAGSFAADGITQGIFFGLQNCNKRNYWSILWAWNDFQCAYIRSNQPIMYASVQTSAIGRRRKFYSRRNSMRNISDFQTPEL